MSNIQIWTDGCCIKNPGGAGAWAYIIQLPNKEELDNTGFESSTTSNRMEIVAAIEAIEKVLLETIAGKIIIYSDSQYLVRCMHEKWYIKWIRRGWKRGKQQEVKNEDLWRRLVSLVQRLDIEWKWIRGHQEEDNNNNKCDVMCNLCLHNNLETDSESENIQKVSFEAAEKQSRINLQRSKQNWQKKFWR